MKEFLAFLHRLASRSGEVIIPYFGMADLAIERKKDDSPVTLADKNAEAAMRDLIHATYPDHGIVGEEYGNENEGAEFVWVLDPIDGTISFTHHCPLWGTLIALLHCGKPVLGAIHQPVLRQLCVGDGQNSTLNDRPIRVRECPALNQATLLTTDLMNISRYQDEAKFADLRSRVKLFRTWGDCYGYLLLCAGGGDIMLDPIMKIWDVAALVPIIQGAGGQVSGWHGGDPMQELSCVASSAAIHDEVLKILKSSRSF